MFLRKLLIDLFLVCQSSIISNQILGQEGGGSSRKKGDVVVEV